jgi:hypothetical protein
MRFYTHKWWSDVQLGDSSSPFQAYLEYFDSVRSQLPPAALHLHESESLHDSSVCAINIEVTAAQARVDLRGWDREGNERRIYALSYSQVSSFVVSGAAESPLVGPFGFGDLGYDEFHVLGPGAIEHRLLFSSGVEVAIVFSGFQFTASPPP